MWIWITNKTVILAAVCHFPVLDIPVLQIQLSFLNELGWLALACLCKIIKNQVKINKRKFNINCICAKYVIVMWLFLTFKTYKCGNFAMEQRETDEFLYELYDKLRHERRNKRIVIISILCTCYILIFYFPRKRSKLTC